MKIVFLGGTCGNNHWREDVVIPELLGRGVQPESLFNPVVPNWTPECQAREDEVKQTVDYLLFVIAAPDAIGSVSGYSLVELVMSLYDVPSRTVACFDFTGMTVQTAKHINKAMRDLCVRFPDSPIFNDYDTLIDWLEEHLK